MSDLISRQAAIDAIVAWTVEDRPDIEMPTDLVDRVNSLPALEQQEQDSNKCCETCKYKDLAVSENPCDECYFASDYEDYYEAEEDNEG